MNCRFLRLATGPAPLATRTAETDSVGNTWSFDFGSDGKITTRTSPGFQHSYTAYNPDGSVLSTQDQVNVTTAYGAYNPSGTVSSVTRDVGTSASVRYDYAYDPNFPAKVSSITPKVPATGVVDPNWQASRYDYY